MLDEAKIMETKLDLFSEDSSSSVAPLLLLPWLRRVLEAEFKGCM